MSATVMWLKHDRSDQPACGQQGHQPYWASECPDVENYKWRLNPVWHRMLYSCTRMATVGFKGLNRSLIMCSFYNMLMLMSHRNISCISRYVTAESEALYIQQHNEPLNIMLTRNIMSVGHYDEKHKTHSRWNSAVSRSRLTLGSEGHRPRSQSHQYKKLKACQYDVPSTKWKRVSRRVIMMRLTGC